MLGHPKAIEDPINHRKEAKQRLGSGVRQIDARTLADYQIQSTLSLTWVKGRETPEPKIFMLI
jgi:hypothetical protein